MVKPSAPVTLTCFYLPHCPHCKLAARCLGDLQRENPAYAAVAVNWIDESAEKALADSYDYWNVPCFYLGREKLFEGHMEKADVKAVLDAALARA